MKIRLATNEDGPRIRELQPGDIEGLNWSEIYPYWIVAEHRNKLVGCLNVAVSKPIGRLDFMAIDPELRPHARGRTVRALINQGLSTLKQAECSASISQIPFDLRTYKRILKKHFGAMVLSQGNMLLRVL